MIYKNLEAALADQHLTVNRLAKITGITSSDLYSAVNGRRYMFPGWRRRIAEALNVSEEKLFPEFEMGND